MTTKKPKQEVAEESETTENEFSELDTKNEVKFRGPSQETRNKIKNSLKDQEEDKSIPKTSMTRNIPIEIKHSNLKVRTFWTIIMLVSFIGIVAAGHLYCALLVLLLNTGMVKEILSLRRNRERENEVQFSVSLNWYFCSVAVFYFYGRLFSSLLLRFQTNKIVYILVNYHDFISFVLWIAGFLMFTLSLKKGYLRYQFRQFGWTHLCLVLIMGQGAAIVNNIYEGIIWFLFPALLVISNDIFAYLFGITFGKTRLIELSPKKTLEGFIGGLISTLFFAFIFSAVFSRFDYLICPQYELTLKPFDFITCKPPLTFQYFDYHFPGLEEWSFKISEFQIHAIILACFTSLVSPFGGFFASGFKRAIKVKDFADIIPGHGGITDRMDCQILTGAFVYLYVRQIVNGRINYVNGVTRFIMGEMDSANQLLIFHELQKMLTSKGVLNATIA